MLFFGVSKKDIVSLRKICKNIQLLKYWYRGSFPYGYVAALDNDTFAIINMQPSNMQGEHCIMIANSRQTLYFADSLGRKKYSFLKQRYEQIMPEPLQSHPSVCGFNTIYAAFHLFKFRREEITGVHDVNVLSFISKYMNFFIVSTVNVQVIKCLCYYSYILINFLKQSFYIALSHNIIRKRNNLSARVIKYEGPQKLYPNKEL